MHLDSTSNHSKSSKSTALKISFLKKIREIGGCVDTYIKFNAKFINFDQKTTKATAHLAFPKLIFHFF
jgi:hypothetical protein